MTQNIVVNSQHSEMASKASIEAKKIAIDGGVVVRKTIDSIAEVNDVIYNAADVMKKLGDSSNEISNVVELIEEIADQTNLLALNAAIEAARAGEQGRGFAVVADEVKKLSERTSAAIKNVAEMIRRIQSDSNGAINAISKGIVKVNNGREYAKQASTSLEKIIESVSKVSNIIEQVAIANEQQSQGAQHISESMVMISNVSKDNASRAEQVTSAISDLRNLTNGLQNGISKFDIGKSLNRN
jgi:methyl-accepting chemotaxis protein